MRVWILAAMLVLSGAAFAAESGWPYPDELRSRLTFVHPMVNYSVHPVWQRSWEMGLARDNGLQATSGSVSSEDLFTDLKVNITQPLNDRFRFLYRMHWLDGLHLDISRQEHWLGFEMGLTRGFGIQLQVQPTPDKEELGLLAGFLVTDSDRERYLRLSLRFDDLLYERKNDLGGASESEPVRLQWELRYRTGPWEIFSTGLYGSGSERSYPDSTLSPRVAGSELQSGESTIRLRYLWSPADFVSLNASHYKFEGSEQRRDTEADYRYDNEYLHLRGLGVFGIGGPWGMRPEMHWLRQWASAEGRRDFDHQRDDFYPAVFFELHAPGKSTWELGYMGVHYQWDYQVGSWSDNRDGYTDKIKFGWTYAFQPTAFVQFSISHELDLDRFGGGNVQFQMLF